MWFSEAQDLILYVGICFYNVEVQIVKDNALTIAYITLLTGIVLLAFTFISAYIFLISNQPISGSSDLIDTFGDSLAPLIEASIRIMFLGVMGWIGSILTARGVQLLTQLRRLEKLEVQSTTPTVEKPRETRKTRKS
jgi:hypothetical protein